jgi:hypothetical protein
MLSGFMDVACDGTLVLSEADLMVEPYTSRLLVYDRETGWRAITGIDNVVRADPQFSPDGSCIAYRSLRPSAPGKGFEISITVGTIPSDKALLKEVSVAGPGASGFEWGADSHHLYILSGAEGAGVLEDVAWPSLTKHEVTRGDGLFSMSVASDSGDAALLVGPTEETLGGGIPDGSRVAVWLLKTDGHLEKTKVAFENWPLDIVVSPQGDRLAVATKKAPDPRVARDSAAAGRGWALADGLAVYSLSDGASKPIPGFESKLVRSLAWTRDGRAVVFVEGQKRLWLVPVGR